MSRRGHWAGAVEDLAREHGPEALRVDGTLPADLAGTLYRVGPAGFWREGSPDRCVLDGDGAVSAVRFDGGRATGAIRFVDTASRRAAVAGKAAGPGIGTPARSPWRRPAGKARNVANTALLARDGGLFALWEGGLPFELDPETLATRGPSSFDGVVGWAFAAHPRRVAARGTTVGFGVMPLGPRSRIDLFELPDGGAPRKIGHTWMTGYSWVHDAGATERYLVLLIPPMRLRVARTFAGRGTLLDNLVWRPELGTEILVVPIDRPSAVVRLWTEPFFTFHVANAFDEGTDVVVDVIRYPDWSPRNFLLDLRGGAVPGPASPSRVERLRIDPVRGEVRAETLAACSTEFPAVDPRQAGGVHDAIWAAGYETDDAPFDRPHDVIVRIDAATGAVQRWAPGGLVSEPVVAVGADRRWLLAQVYDPGDHVSGVAVADADGLQDGTVAIAWFDHAIPWPLHGLWVGA